MTPLAQRLAELGSSMRGPAKPARAAVSLAQPNRRVEKLPKANATMPIDRPVQTRAEKSPPPKKKGRGGSGATQSFFRLSAGEMRWGGGRRKGGKTKKRPRFRGRLKLVGVIGFEPTTTCTPCKCATGLRHTPCEERSIICNTRPQRKPFWEFFFIFFPHPSKIRPTR